jgi:hypothetical protein
MSKGMRKFAIAVAAAAALFAIPTSAFSQSIQIGPGGVRIDEGRGRGGNARNCGLPAKTRTG